MRAACDGKLGLQAGIARLISPCSAGLVDIALHLDKHLGNIIATHHQRTYYILFAIVFAETGFVLTPFLPGDTLGSGCMDPARSW